MALITDFVEFTPQMNRPRIFGDLSRVHVAKSAALNNTFINTNGGHVYISEFVNTGHYVVLLTGSHDYHLRDKARMDSGEDNRTILIERGAWICSRAIIVGPVKIGEHAVVCAGAVVTKDVEPWTMVGGNPAKFIKRIEEKKHG